ncbi:unnamed protein product [Phytomonas sp. EM1]|nr:unnamed protein product [Phytomonas sp. EM1]|eukprot:CCW59880.1 unnamed protein product [Phytomonas sp. isolate EM1]
MKNSTKRVKAPGSAGNPPGKASKKAKIEKKDPPPTTKSLAKLAKASAKGKSSASGHGGPVLRAPANVLDDEEALPDEESCFGEASLEQPLPPEAEFMQEETLCLDVAVSAVNDDIIVCDDAAPLAFMAPQPLPALDTSPPPAAKGGSGASQATINTSQSTLSVFFNPEVVKFQKGYVRELRTDTKLVDDEYICVDVPYYRSLADDTLLTEEEYHQRSVELMAKPPSPEAPRGKVDDDGAAVVQSPSAARVASKSTARPSVSKQVVKESAPSSRNLLSFFKAKQ